jgi:O-antigen/teichoic acid export membrane protein
MSRLKNFSRNLATSYLQLGVNVIYSLVSIPLILHWLPRAEFGLWAVLVQLMGYVSIIDLGMTSAVARLLVDHKDERSNGNYGSLVKTAFLVSFTQGLIILTTVMLGAPVLANLMKIPPEHRAVFISLLQIQGCFSAFSFCLRPLGLMLYAHQRMDIQACSEMLALAAQLGMLILFLNQGCGIYSFIYANGCTLLMGPIFLSWNCHRLGFLPKAHQWGRASWKIFKSVFSYGKDVFLMGLGAQLITASQTIIVSRCFGLEAAASWSVGTKMFNLIMPLMCRPYGAALPGLYELYARGESSRLRNRFKEMVALTASLGVFLGGAFVLCNSVFVEVWTGGKVIWSPWNDLLLAAWLFASSLQTTHCNFVNVTKQIGGMRYIYFAEGCCFITLAILVGFHWKFSGIIACSILCTVVFSLQYGLRLSRNYFGLKYKELVLEWIWPSLKLAAMLAPIAAVVWAVTGGLSPLPRLICHFFAAGVVGGFLFLRVGLPAGIMNEVGSRLPKPMNRLWQFVSASPS